MKKNIIKVKKFQKPLICLIGILIFVLGMTVEKVMNANADEINYEYVSDSIGYNNEDSTLNATNVKDAIDELYTKVGKCPIGQFCSTSAELIDRFGGSGNFVSAYTYDESVCVTGNESGCVKNNCYSTGDCEAGTIIDYFVNDSTIMRFHVLHDNGSTLTMQTQKNTIYNTMWYLADDNRNGPQTIMAALKIATNGWSNVNDIILTDSMTEFNDGTSTNNKCRAVSCSVYDDDSGYSYNKLINNALIGSTIKARMITITETAALGCNYNVHKSCPIYLYNYLQNTKDNCRVSDTNMCINDTHTENSASYNYGYWTMGSFLDFYSAFIVSPMGNVVNHSLTANGYGARAVVVVNK